MQINNYANEQANKADSDSKVSALETKLTPQKIYDGNVSFTSGQAWVARSAFMFSRFMPMAAQCVGTNAPCMVSFDSANAGVFVTLPISPSATGTFQVIIYGIGWN